MEKVSLGNLTPEPLCMGFFDRNFERRFFDNPRITSANLAGIFSAKMSMISLEKKRQLFRLNVLKIRNCPPNDFEGSGKT
jgi:hypothetical protein